MREQRLDCRAEGIQLASRAALPSSVANGFRTYDQEAGDVITREIDAMVRSQLSPTNLTNEPLPQVADQSGQLSLFAMI
jgi:hypothetical protein